MCCVSMDKHQVNDAFTVVYSGGRDRRVWATDLRNSSNHMLLCEERSPVLKVSLQYTSDVWPFSLSRECGVVKWWLKCWTCSDSGQVFHTHTHMCLRKHITPLLPSISSWSKVMLIIMKIKKIYSTWTVTCAIADAIMTAVSFIVREHGSLYIEVCAFRVLCCWWLTTGNEILLNVMPDNKHYNGEYAMCCSWRQPRVRQTDRHCGYQPLTAPFTTGWVSCFLYFMFYQRHMCHNRCQSIVTSISAFFDLQQFSSTQSG